MPGCVTPMFARSFGFFQVDTHRAICAPRRGG
jgi:hypothetical protein